MEEYEGELLTEKELQEYLKKKEQPEQEQSEEVSQIDQIFDFIDKVTNTNRRVKSKTGIDILKELKKKASDVEWEL